MKKIFYPILAGLSLCLISASPAVGSRFSGTQDEKDQIPLRHDVTVTLRLVQVQVVDKSGQPVTDLEKSDFALKDNGKPRVITDFEKHISPEAAMPPEPQSPASSGVSSRLNRKFMFFFDFAFNTPTGVRKAKEAALDFIDTRISPDDEIGVVSYSARMGLKLHEFLTRDHAKVRQIIADLGGARAMGRAIDMRDRYYEELKSLNEALGLTGGGGSSSSEWIEITKAIEQKNYESCVTDFTAQAKDLALSLRYVPGQKNIIFFSSGIANFILYGKRLEGTAGYYVSLSDNWGNSALREAFSDMSKALASSNCIIYTVNVLGQASGRFDDRMLFQGSGSYDDKNLSGDLSLKQLAGETGGRYFDNVKNYETINKEIQRSTGSYYVLGYYIDDRIDGKYHKVEVEVKRKGCRVFGQKGYFDPKPFSEHTANEKLLQLIDLALSDRPYLQEAVNFPLIVLPYALGAKAGLAFLAKVPAGKIVQAAGQRVEALTLVFDQKQDVVAFKREEVAGWPASQEDAFVSSLISLDPGEYQCRVVLRNMETGMGARGSCRVSIAAGQSSRFMLLAPLILRPGKGTVFVNGATATIKNPARVLFTDIYPFDTERYCPLTEPLAGTNTELSVVVRCQGSGLRNPELVFSAQLVAVSSGEIVPVSTSVVKQSENGQAFVSELRLITGELKPGEYTLTLFAGEKNSGQSSTATNSFKVD